MLGDFFEICSIGDDGVPLEMAASEYAGTELKHSRCLLLKPSTATVLINPWID
jgi:hypothetical protein